MVSPMHATQISAYTYQAQTLCPHCTMQAVSAATNTCFASIAPAELFLDQMATTLGIDREDEHSFDSSDFPKVVFASQLDQLDHFPHDCGYDAGCTGCLPERCDNCGGEL